MQYSMNLFGILSLFIFSTIFVEIYSSESSSTSQTQQRIFDFDLNAFITQINGYFQGQVPLYFDIVQDINNKLSEFRSFTGIQSFLSYGSLYSQYIQLYSVWREQDTLLLNSIKQLSDEAAGPVGPFLYFYPQNFHHLVKALEAYITAEQQSVKGILRIVNAFFSAVTNPEFTYTETTFALPSSNVIEIQNGMNQWAAANQQIVNASQLFVYAFNGTLLYQNNGNTLKYIQALINLNQKIGDNLMTISNVEMHSSQLFGEQNILGQQSNGMYNASIQEVYKIFSYGQKKISEYFIKIINAGNEFQSNVLSNLNAHHEGLIKSVKEKTEIH